MSRVLLRVSVRLSVPQNPVEHREDLGDFIGNRSLKISSIGGADRIFEWESGHQTKIVKRI